MNKLMLLFSLFRQGSSLVDSKLWKERQVKVTVLAGVILALVHALAAFGYPLPVDTETANAIAGGIIALVNVILTVCTSDKVGLKPLQSPSVALEEPKVSPSINQEEITQQRSIREVKDETAEGSTPNLNNNFIQLLNLKRLLPWG